jgi:hypothetical protein
MTDEESPDSDPSDPIEGLTEVDLTEDDAEPAKLTFDDDDPNLVEAFMAHPDGKKALQDISGDVRRRFDADWDSSEQARERVAQDIALLAGDLSRKKGPWKDAANLHVPSMLENVSRLTARMESEIIGDGKNMFGVMPTGPGGEEEAQILSLHGNWQLTEKIPDFKRQMSKAIMNFIVVGDVTVHSYWDPEMRMNRHEVLTLDEFVTPYTYTTMMPDYSDLPHYTKVLRRYKHQIESMRDVWYDVENVLEKRKPSFDDEPDAPIREERENQEGITKPDDDSGAAPYKLLWHEGWFTLPGRDKQRWCLVIQDHATDSILSLSIHEEVNWQEQQRFERQSSELSMYRQVQEIHQSSFEQLRQLGDEVSHRERITSVDPMAVQALGQQTLALHQQYDQMQAQMPPEPSPPHWMKDPTDPAEQPEPPRRNPIWMFAHGVCLEPMAGNLGLSLGRIQSDLNMAEDTLLNQFGDAATLANVPPFFVDDNVEIPTNSKTSPGAFIKVQGVMTKSIADSIYKVPLSPANPQLMDLVKELYQWAGSSAQSPGVLSGESGKSGETFRGIQARIEQATKQLSVPAGHFCNPFFKQVLMNNARLNATYLDDDELVYLLDTQKGEYANIQVSKRLYQRDYNVTINADLRFASQAQKIQEAEQLIQLPKAVPALQSNLGFQYYTVVKYFQAAGKSEVIQYLGKPPPPTQQFGVPPPPSPEQMQAMQVQAMQAQTAQAMAQAKQAQQGANNAPKNPGGPPAGGPPRPPNGAPQGPPPGPQGPSPQGIPGPRPMPPQ